MRVYNIFVPITFSVIKSNHNLCILGTDFLMNHRCVIDYSNRSIKINDDVVKFLNDAELEESKDWNQKGEFKEMIENIKSKLIDVC